MISSLLIGRQNNDLGKIGIREFWIVREEEARLAVHPLDPPGPEEPEDAGEHDQAEDDPEGNFVLVEEGPQRLVLLARQVGLRRVGAERLQLALDAGHMGTWDWNLLTGSMAWSASLERLHGLAPGTFPGTFEAVLETVHPEDRALVRRAVARAVEEGTDDAIEYRILEPDGRIRWLHVQGRTYRNEAGKPARMVGVATDITERALAELPARLGRAPTIADIAERLEVTDEEVLEAFSSLDEYTPEGQRIILAEMEFRGLELTAADEEPEEEDRADGLEDEVVLDPLVCARCEVPLDYVQASDLGAAEHYFTITLEYGPDHDKVDPFDIEVARISQSDAARAHEGHYLHPVVRHHRPGPHHRALPVLTSSEPGGCSRLV